MKMNWWKQKFIEHYDVNHIALELLNLIDDEEKLQLYIMETFSKDFTREGIINIFEEELTENELNAVLSELGKTT